MPWYEIKAKAGGDSIEVLIYDEIGYWGVTASQFIKDFQAIDDGISPVVVGINSPGGDVFDGIALNAFLSRLGKRCTARIDGLAASAASLIAVGAAKVEIAEGAMMMIHNPWTWASGNAADLRKIADDMDKVQGSLISLYTRKAPQIENLQQMLDDETWLSAEESVALGLADVITDRPAAKACASSSGILTRYRNKPAALVVAEEAPPADPPPDPEPSEDAPDEPASEAGSSSPEPETEPEPETLEAAALIADALASAGLSSLCKDIIMTAKAQTKADGEAEAARIKAITDACKLAKLPELAAEYVKAGLSAEAVRARLFDRLASGPEINASEPKPPTDRAAAKEATPTASQVYAARKTRAKA